MGRFKIGKIRLKFPRTRPKGPGRGKAKRKEECNGDQDETGNRRDGEMKDKDETEKKPKGKEGSLKGKEETEIKTKDENGDPIMPVAPRSSRLL